MVALRGHFDGDKIVLDEPIPRGVGAHTPVRVVFEQANGETGTAQPSGQEDVLNQLAAIAAPSDLPADFAAQHEHYTRGLPKR